MKWVGLLACLLLAQPDADPRIERIVASVSQQRLQSIVTKLAGFGTRETLSDTTSTTRGIGAARQWIFDELKRSSPKLQVSFDTYQVAAQGRITRPVELRNVIAILPGRTPRRIYVTGHYDSVNLSPGVPQNQPGFDNDADAPGANDDASGTALTMELARTLAESGIEFDATLVFACWAGEEQGLIGSSAHAQNARVNAAAVASLGLAPPAPKVTNERDAVLISRDPSGYDASLRWAASPGAVAYRIYWRDAWSNDWQKQQTIGNVTHFVLPNVSIDDFVFGVAAIGPDRQESLISAYVSPIRPVPEVKMK